MYGATARATGHVRQSDGGKEEDRGWRHGVAAQDESGDERALIVLRLLFPFIMGRTTLVFAGVVRDA